VKYFAWALGAALFAHAVTFISVSYFDQNVIIFYLLLASISVLRVVVASPVVQPGKASSVADMPVSLSPLLTR
jgi:hypothetical protein